MLLTVCRKKRFAGALCTYQVVTGMDLDSVYRRISGLSLPRMKINELNDVSAGIKNGQTICLEIDTPCEVFVFCPNGTHSLTLCFDGSTDRALCEIDTKGGWKTLPHPCLRLVE